MHKIIISVFILFSLNAQCASWADIAKGKARKPVAPVTQSKPIPPVEIHKPQPASEPVIQQPMIPEHIRLLHQCCHALAAHAPAPTVAQIVEPILLMDVHPLFKSHAHNLVAQACAKEKNTQAELMYLCNELSVSYNDGMLISHNDQQLFPAYNLIAVHRLCELFAAGHLTEFKNLSQGNDESMHTLTELIIRSGHAVKNPHATYLLAQSAEEAGDYARAIELYEMLPTTYAQPLQANITVAKLLHAQTDSAALQELFETITADTALQTPILAILEEKEHSNIVQSFWQHIYKTRQGNDKSAAAFKLNHILRNTNAKMADVYLGLAIAAGNQDACKEAYERSFTELNEQQAIKLLEMAANGGYIAAQLKCGQFYRKKSTHPTAEPKERADNLKKAQSFFKKAAEQDSPRAYIELATLRSNIPEVLVCLEALAHTPTFPLRAEAYQKIGDVYLESAKSFAGETLLSTEQDRHFDLAEKAFKTAASLGYPYANISRAATLLEAAFYTNAPAIKRTSFAQAEKILKDELRANKNATIAAAYLGRLYMQKKNIASASTYFILAFEKEPNNVDSLNLFSETIDRMRKNKKYGEIKKLATSMLERHPECGHAHVAMGFVHLEHENNLQAARTSYKKAGKFGYSLGYDNLAITYYDKKYNNQNYEKALKYFHKSQEATPILSKYLVIMAKCYRALARDAEAISTLKKGADAGDPNCMISLADYYHRGCTGKEELNGDDALKEAGELYRRASGLYKKSDPVLANFCDSMHFIIIRKQNSFLPGVPGDAEWLCAFNKLIKELNDFASRPNLPEGMIDEIRNTLAINHMTFARCTNDESKIKSSCLSALSEMDKSTGKSPVKLFRQIQALMLLRLANLLDTSIPQEALYNEMLPKILTKLIYKLETKHPTNPILRETYNLYGLYCQSESQHNDAVLYFKKASVHGSIHAALNLFEYYQKINDATEASIWLDNINEWVARQSSLDQNSEITQRLLAIRVTPETGTSAQAC